jgi:hypothetical protein
MKNRKEISVRREVSLVILYGIALAFVTSCLYPFLPDMFARWTAPQTWHPSLNVALHMDPMVATPVMLSVIACLVYLPTLRHGRNRLPWIAIQVSLVGIMVVMLGATFKTISEGRKILDSTILEALARLHVGMPRSAAEALVLQSNMLVLGTHANELLHGEGIEEFMTQRLERAQHGETGMLVFDRRIPLGLFSQEERREQAEAQIKRWYYMEGVRSQYTLTLRFDAQDRLESAGYTRAAVSDGSAVHCEVIFQLPATNPSPCDSTSNLKI